MVASSNSNGFVGAISGAEATRARPAESAGVKTTPALPRAVACNMARRETPRPSPETFSLCLVISPELYDAAAPAHDFDFSASNYSLKCVWRQIRDVFRELCVRNCEKLVESRVCF